MSDKEPDWFDSSKPDDHDERVGGGEIVIDRTPLKKKQKLKPPPQFAVVMLNDDFTPIDFVIEILMNIFGKSFNEAEAVTMDVHKRGKGVAGVFTKDIAETKAILVNKIAQKNEHPFMCQVEPA
jgi:ATP-dependent Clp protease adaptor protein ClpS